MSRKTSKMIFCKYDGWNQLSVIMIYMTEAPTWEDEATKWLQAAKPLNIAASIL